MNLFEIKVTECEVQYNPPRLTNEYNEPVWTPPTPEEIAAYEKHWKEELSHCNFFRAVLLDRSKEPHTRKAIESPYFRRDGIDVNGRTKELCSQQLFEVIGQVLHKKAST